MVKKLERVFDFDGYTVLVVEDIELNRKLIGAMLEETGINIVQAIHGADAIKILEAHLQPDIILMDVIMPVMDGNEATAKINSVDQYKNVPIVLLTAGALKGQIESARKAGCDEIILKPINSDELLNILNKLLNNANIADN